MDKLQLHSNDKKDIIDITKLLQDVLERNGTQEGFCHIFTPHTTCAVSTADLDPGTAQDYGLAADSLLKGITFNHPHNPEHFPAHFLATMIGPSLSIPIERGEFILGEWQRIVLLEFDGPKNRQILIAFTPEHEAPAVPSSI